MEENIIYKIEILKIIEDKFSIEIKDEEIETLNSIEDLIEIIKKKKSYLINV